MKSSHKKLHRILTLALGLSFALGSLVWIQPLASSATAQEAEPNSVVMTIKVEESEGGLSLAAVGTAPIFDVGDQFKISIVAENVTDPGIFGSQFHVLYDPIYLQAVEDSLISGTDMEPVVMAVAEIDNEAGKVAWAASRQGDLEDVNGDVVLATFSLQAIASTEPPEGQTTAITLGNVKLGARGGIDVPISGIQGLDIIIRDDGTTPGLGDITGTVIVEGRATDNQAGHSVTATGTDSEFSAISDGNGLFHFDNVPADSYNMTANSSGFLAASCVDVVHSMDVLTQLVQADLLAGDIDDDGTIDITDAVAIGLVFESTQPGLVEDLNVDDVVDILDLILMSANYGQTSEANPWVCQLANEL